MSMARQNAATSGLGTLADPRSSPLPSSAGPRSQEDRDHPRGGARGPDRAIAGRAWCCWVSMHRFRDIVVGIVLVAAVAVDVIYRRRGGPMSEAPPTRSRPDPPTGTDPRSRWPEPAGRDEEHVRQLRRHAVKTQDGWLVSKKQWSHPMNHCRQRSLHNWNNGSTRRSAEMLRTVFFHSVQYYNANAGRSARCGQYLFKNKVSWLVTAIKD